MKIRLLTVMILPAMLLTSCRLLQERSTFAKEIQIYDLDNISEDGDVEEGHDGKIVARFYEGEDYIPYITLRQYASLYKNHLAPNATSTCESEDHFTWSVRLDDQYVFMTEINPSSRAIAVAGSLDSAYKDNDNPVDTKALMAGMHSKYASLESGTGYATYSYAGTGIKTFKYDGEYYFPLSLLDLTYSYDTSIYFFYNYAGIYSTKDVEHYSDKHFSVDGVLHNVDSQMLASKQDNEMPKYLREFNANAFLYLMDNMYGLKEYKGIKTMKSYYKSNNIYNKLFSTTSNNRAQAYADALDIFDDNHTALVSANETWGEDNYITRRLSKGIASRRALNQRLTANRKAYYESYFGGQEVKPGDDIVYSADGKTAMYMFNSFSFAPQDIYDGTDKQALYKADTFFNLIHIFDTIKAKGGVENIILDISTNGGGTVGVMMKLLSLISKDNSSYVYYKEAASSQVISAHCAIDSNGDEACDETDAYGNDFNFYILTSDCSYSCANAFPCTAQIQGMAKIIGQKSGGGECAVAIHYLPNSQYVYHSSMLHLGNYDKANREFVGFESGAKPDIEIQNEADFYDIEKLNNFIANA
ncbi:MAG: hypothetical protein J6X50_01225 [Bacilli bacterium]|nr:hypothetical protein [Bacilli bacterium]